MVTRQDLRRLKPEQVSFGVSELPKRNSPNATERPAILMLHWRQMRHDHLKFDLEDRESSNCHRQRMKWVPYKSGADPHRSWRGPELDRRKLGSKLGSKGGPTTEGMSPRGHRVKHPLETPETSNF